MTDDRIPPKGGSSTVPPRHEQAVTEHVYLTGYYYRLEVDGQAITIGFATHQELMNHLETFDRPVDFLKASDGREEKP